MNTSKLNTLTDQELLTLKGGRRRYYIKFSDKTIEVTKEQYDCFAETSH